MEKVKSFFSYLFGLNPGTEFKFYIPMLILGTVLILGAIVFSFIYSKKRKHDFAFKRLFKKVSTVLTVMGILVLFFSAVRYENIPYFSMRIWFYTTLLVLLYFLYRYIRIFMTDYKKEKNTITTSSQEKVEVKSYLPNKKRKH